MGRPGVARVEVVGPRDAIRSVRVGGSGVTVLLGRLTVDGEPDAKPGSATISHLARREAQAPLVSSLIDAYAKRFGKEEALEVAREVIRADAARSGRELAERFGGSSLETLLDVVREVWAEDGTMEVADVRLSDRALAFDVTRCGYAAMYRRLGLQELGGLMSCDRDFPFQDGFNPDIRLTRTKTIMEGADCCDFRYVMKDRGDEGE